jgi:hypothetical protein
MRFVSVRFALLFSCANLGALARADELVLPNAAVVPNTALDLRAPARLEIDRTRRNLRLSGIVLTALGAASVPLGGALISLGTTANGAYAGVPLITLGVPSLLVGIPLWIAEALSRDQFDSKRNYRVKEVVGIVVAALGATMITIGIPLVVLGLEGSTYHRGFDQFVGGAAALGLGGLQLAVGIPMWAISRWRRKSAERLGVFGVTPVLNGRGAALSFAF